MAFLSLNNVSFFYGKSEIIRDFSLDVEQGSFTTLLGASGCGKTTLLRLISGFLKPTEGTVSINGQVQNEILPNKRKIGMVFQDYALFPHMTVEQNLLYGLKLKKGEKRTKEQNAELVQKTAENLNLQKLLKRYPSELSGGQQQRVALGRTLVLEPHILLMDEPLSSLDAKLRLKVREELKEIQQRLKITTIYVTHDQEEALSLSDRIAVLRHGSLLQYGTPEQIYFEPKDKYVADFVGRANFIRTGNGDGGGEFLVRPEWIALSKGKNGASADFTGTVVSKEFLGTFLRYRIKFENQEIVVDQNPVSTEAIATGDKVGIKILKKWEIK
ncbi:MAG: ABC transporter ATP-binding protein [Treponema sp.]|nr:ABC transporter ATP-binding protein [Treponema sp.]